MSGCEGQPATWRMVADTNHGTMTRPAGSSAREPELLGQTVVLIGGSAASARTARARSEGADVILIGRNPERLGQVALDVDARSTAAFDANDAAALKQFFDGLPDPIDHVLVTAAAPTTYPCSDGVS